MTTTPDPAANPTPHVVIIGAGPAGLTAADDPGLVWRLAGRARRVAPLPPLLQDVQREALGSPDEQAPRGLRRATHQEPLVHERGDDRVAAEAQPEGDHLPHRGIPVSEAR